MPYTLPAATVFAPTDGGGNPRGANMSQVQTWGTEVEAGITSLQSLYSLLKNAINAFDYLTDAERADVIARTQTVDVSTGMTAWKAACLLQRRPGYAPSGTYRFDSPWWIDGSANPTSGWHFFGDGTGLTRFDFTRVASGTVPLIMYCAGGTPSAPVSHAYGQFHDIEVIGSRPGHIIQIGLDDYSDYMNFMTLKITCTNASTSSTANLFRFNACYDVKGRINGVTASPPRSILTLSTITGGSGYTNGTYTARAATGGSGNFAALNVTVSGGAVTAVTIASAGFGFNAGESLTVSNTLLGGTGSGFSVLVGTVNITTSTGAEIRKMAFSKLAVSFGACSRGVRLMDRESYGNIFYPDMESVDYSFLIDSANATQNTIIAGTTGHYVAAMHGVAGSDNIWINPNVNSGAAFFLSTVGVSRFDQTTMAPKASPTFTGTVSAAAISATGNITTSAAILQGANTVVDSAGGLIVIPEVTTANLGSKTHAINTTLKVKGRLVVNTTTQAMYRATGSADVSPWYLVDGSAAITPA